MSTMTFDAAGIPGVGEVSHVKKPLVKQQAPRLNPVREVAPAPARARRTTTLFGTGSAVSYECDGWMRWTGA